MYTYTDGPVIKGSRDGLVIVLDGRMTIEAITNHLESRIRVAEDFFREAHASIKIMHETWDQEQVEMIRSFLNKWQITIDDVSMGVQGESAEDDPQQDDEADDFRSKLAEDIHDILSIGPEDRTAAQPIPEMVKEAPVVQEKSTHLIRRTLRSGQHIRYDGHVVVIGDVNPGAEVTASGDIIVFGSFRGVAHAGATGDEGAVVAALKLQPTQLRIGNYISRAPDERNKLPDRPEIARIKSGNIEIESFLI